MTANQPESKTATPSGRSEAFETIERPGHFICSRQCKFGRITLIPGYFVSSVGEYTPDSSYRLDKRTPEGWTEIGFGRLYETFVFEWSGKRCEDPACDCGGVPDPNSWGEIDSLGANTRADCEANHAALVKKYAAIAKATT